MDRQSRGLSGRTVEFYACELGLWNNWMAQQGATAIADVTPQLLRQWLLHLTETRNVGGVHASYRSLKTFLYWVWEENDLTPPNPISKVRAAKPSQEPLAPLSLEDLKVLLGACDGSGYTGVRDRALFLALLDTGCRATEFLSLNIGDVNLASGAVAVRHGKGNKPRVTFLGIKSRQAIRRYLRTRRDATPDAPLWTTSQELRLTCCGLRSILRRRAGAAGMTMPTPHSFRRAFAISSLRNGVDVYSLQRLMGHADLTILRRYLRQTDEDLQEAHRRGGPVDHLL